MAHSGGLGGLGFHTTGSPHTKAMAAFQAYHTATGKLNAADARAPGPAGATARTSGGRPAPRAACGRRAIRDRPDREVADVDHLLDLALGLLDALADLGADDLGEVVLVLAQHVAHLADQLAALGTGDLAKGGEGCDRGVDLRDGGGLVVDREGRQRLAVGRIDDRHAIGGVRRRGQAHRLEDLLDFGARHRPEDTRRPGAVDVRGLNRPAMASDRASRAALCGHSRLAVDRWRALRRRFFMPSNEATPRTVVADRALRCPHCDGAEFAHRRAQLNTALATFFGLDAHNQSADVYACRRCGRLEWFVPPDLRHLADTAPSMPDAPAVECPQCNMIIPAQRSRCGTCGWSRSSTDP